MSSISVTCQPRIAIDNHKKNLRSIWSTKEWRTESAEYKARHPAKCSRCGKEGPIVPGHCEGDYNDMLSYIKKVRNDQVVPLCPRCNQQEAKGKHPCPVCIEKHAADPEHRINYITRDQESCRMCEPDYNPETSKFRHEHGNRIKNRLTRKQYRKLRPGKKIVNGVWVYVKPVQAVAKKGGAGMIGKHSQSNQDEEETFDCFGTESWCKDTMICETWHACQKEWSRRHREELSRACRI